MSLHKYLLIVILFIGCSDNSDEEMKLFISSLSAIQSEVPPTFPIADDGYLYVYAMGQSNMRGTYPNTSSELYPGDKTNPTNVYIPDMVGGWVLAEYNEDPFGAYANNIAITFCRELADEYDLQIRLIFNALGSKEIEQWYVGDVMWVDLQATWDSFNTTNDIRTPTLWLMHQGENNQLDTFEVYYPKWSIVRQQLIDANYLTSNHVWIGGELARVRTFNDVLRGIKDTNINYRLAHSDGMEKGDIVHFLGTGLEGMGYRYINRYKEVIFNLPAPNDLVTPTKTNVTVTNVTSSGCTLTWTASTPNTGLTIVKYKIYSQNGWIYLQEVDGVTLTANVLFTYSSGETEYFNVLGEDNVGNTTQWLATGYDAEVLIP